jgi:uncharacterized membrane protein YdjX (TVP38/TMEM64 family)
VRRRYILIASWLLFLAACLYVYYSHNGAVQDELQRAASVSVVWGYGLYLLLGCVRGFTLIPSANLVLVAVLLIPPIPLFVLTLVGILVSSASIYWFSEALHLDEYFETRHAPRLAKMKDILQKNEMPIIIGWSFFPLAPTDAICYLCGVMKVNFLKFIVGILIGEGTICGIYIFLGDGLLHWLRLRS